MDLAYYAFPIELKFLFHRTSFHALLFCLLRY